MSDRTIAFANQRQVSTTPAPYQSGTPRRTCSLWNRSARCQSATNSARGTRTLLTGILAISTADTSTQSIVTHRASNPKHRPQALTASNSFGPAATGNLQSVVSLLLSEVGCDWVSARSLSVLARSVRGRAASPRSSRRSGRRRWRRIRAPPQRRRHQPSGLVRRGWWRCQSSFEIRWSAPDATHATSAVDGPAGLALLPGDGLSAARHDRRPAAAR